jgi:DNA ligase-1
VLLADVVTTSERVATTSRRSEKVATLADLLRRLEPDEIRAAVGFLIGRPRQGRVGVGWATMSGLAVTPALEPVLTVREVDAVIERIGTTSGAGSAGERQRLLAALWARATEPETTFLWRIFTGELRQGALEGMMTDAIARAAGTPLDLVRRAAMFSGDLGRTAEVALTAGRPGLEGIGLTVLHPVQPMLAGTSPSVAAALEETGPASVEWKLDGARIQVHRDGDDVRIYTRSLNDVTERLPRVADAVRGLPATRVVLDGESIGIHDDGRPRRFQDTMSRFGTSPGGTVATATEATGAALELQAFFFDLLHVDGEDLVDAPLAARLARLEEVAAEYRLPAVVTADPDEAEAFARTALAAGHEGVMVKALEAPYQAGRRGASWRKVKPVRTLDLVVLAAEWGHGRRSGWLSNLHLGARGESGSFVMVGKTFKGLTDELLRWQTERFQELAVGTEGHVVHIRPELVVEIALDGVQVSRRYPGGVALRFARVRRYRPDKQARDADTIDTVRALLG